MIRIDGFCPMGCGETLFVGDGGCITCSYISCPEPSAVHVILTDAETEHLVTFERNDFTIKHPLRERVGDELLECALHAHLAKLNRPPVPPGTYRAERLGSAWIYQPVSEVSL